MDLMRFVKFERKWKWFSLTIVENGSCQSHSKCAITWTIQENFGAGQSGSTKLFDTIINRIRLQDITIKIIATSGSAEHERGAESTNKKNNSRFVRKVNIWIGLWECVCVDNLNRNEANFLFESLILFYLNFCIQIVDYEAYRVAVKCA